jgi:hypothetical protein
LIHAHVRGLVQESEHLILFHLAQHVIASLSILAAIARSHEQTATNPAAPPPSHPSHSGENHDHEPTFVRWQRQSGGV